MISPELIRRYPFFAGFDHEQILKIAKLSSLKSVEAGEYFFSQGDKHSTFYLVVEGAVGIIIQVPNGDEPMPVAEQLAGDFKTRDVIVSTVGTGDTFAWSAIIPPHYATASAKAITDCRVIAVDCDQLESYFEESPEFGYVMAIRAAQVIRERLRDMRIESLAFVSD